MRPLRGTSPLSTVKRLINKPSRVLLIKDDRILRILITQLLNLRLIARADGKPVEVGIRLNLLAFIEEANDARTKHVAAEVGGQFLVEIDVLAVGLHALDAGDVGCLGREPFRCVGAVR